MKQLTILLLQTGPAAENAAIREALPRVRRHLARRGGFLGQPFALEMWDDVERTVASSEATAERIARRDDIAAVLMWGGSWAGPATAAIQQAFVERTAQLPILYLSGSVRPDHALHPGSFSLAPAFRDKVGLLRRLTESFPDHARIAWISKANDDASQRDAVRRVAEARGLPLWSIELPAGFETTNPSPAEWHAVRAMIEERPPATHWFLGAFAINRPLREWLASRRVEEVVALNTGPRPEWFRAESPGGEIFFGSEGYSERADLTLPRELLLRQEFPRIKLDCLLLLQHAASRVAPLPADADRATVFESWLRGMKTIDGRRSVFVGTRSAFWFDPETRMRVSGAVALKRRLPGSDQGLLHPMQVDRRSDGSESLVPVVAVHVDLLQMERVSVEDQSVELDFYLDLRSETSISFRDLRLVNAKRRTLSVQPLVDHPEIEQGRTVHVRRYRITGVFSFTPNVRSHPLDFQSVEIEIAPANPLERMLLLQPPPRDRLDREFDVPGWRIVDADVSTHTMFWHAPTSLGFEMRFVPYSAAGFHWQIARNAKDVVLFVAVPLTVLLGVSYFGVFSTLEQADEKVGELTGAMLATIALYFATSKPKCDDLTILDRAFRISYVAIGGLLGTILLARHLAPEIYGACMRGWTVLFPALLAYEFLRAWGLYRSQRESFRPAPSSSDA